MVNLKENITETINNYKITKKYAVKLRKAKQDEKYPIVFDGMFKTMFQDERKIKYACKLISYLIDVPYEELLKNLKLVKNEANKNKSSDRNLRCDFIAEIGNSKINIEINNNSSQSVMERNLEYANRLYVPVENAKNKEYMQVIQINLNNFAYENIKDTVDYYFLQNKKGVLLTEKLQYIFIYLPNIVEKWYNEEELSEFEKFILGLVEYNVDKALEIGKGIDIMEEYVKDAHDASSGVFYGEAYDKEWALRDEGYRDGLEEGIEQGKIEGIEQNKLEMAKAMLKENMDINLISKLTGLKEEDINHIKNN